MNSKLISKRNNRKQLDRMDELRHRLHGCPDNLFSKHEFTVFCSCLDVIEDTDAAISGFFTTMEWARDEGVDYLRFYGLLQAIFAQQDGLNEICKLIGADLDLKELPEIKSLRNVRNRVVGHPTDGASKHGVTFLLRNTLQQDGFTFAVIDPDGKQTAFQVSVSPILNEQANLVTSVIDQAINFLKGSDQSS